MRASCGSAVRGILLAQFRSTCPLEGNQYKSVLTDHLSPMLKPSILMGEGSFFPRMTIYSTGY